MSHTTTIGGITIQSLSALRGAVEILKAKGIKCSLVENATPRAYFPNQTGLGKADFVLSLDDAPYDVGFYRQKDGTMEARTDFWAGKVERVLGVPHQPGFKGEQYKLGQLFQAYAVNAAEEQARKQGLMVSRQVQADGRIKLVATGF